MSASAVIHIPVIRHHVRADEFELPLREALDEVGAEAFDVYGVFPHMHELGTSMSVKFTRESSADTCVADVPRWDFDWQQFYFFQSRKGLPVERDWSFRLTCEWDNPTDQTVRWGEGTDDEMCLAFVYVTGRVN